MMRDMLCALALLTTLGATRACEAVDWRVEVHDLNLAPGRALYMPGSLAPLGPWDARESNRFEALGEGRRALRLRLPPSTPFEFKLLQRSPAGGAPRWESDQLTPSRNRMARSPACGEQAAALRLFGFDERAAPLSLERAGVDHVDEALPAQPPRAMSALRLALVSTEPKLAQSRLAEALDARQLPAASFAEPLASFVRSTGGVDLLGRRQVKGGDPDTWLLLARARHTGHTLLLPVRWNADGLVAGLQLPHPALRVRPRREATLTQEALLRELRQLLQANCATGAFSGALQLALHGQPKLTHACGLANRRYGVHNQPETRFNLASQNKMFTAVALLQLMEQGKLNLDDRLDRFLGAEWLAPEVARSISLRHLLTHRSGLGSYFSDDFFKASRERFRELADFQALVRTSQPEFEPGEHFAYSNTGYLLLGAVIEKLSGRSYFEQVQRAVFDPAGMVRAGYEAMDMPVAGLAMHYVPGASGTPHAWLETTFQHVFRGGPAGGGYASVSDLTRFASALQGGQLLKPASLALAWPRNGSSNVNSYGMGFELGFSSAGFVVGHSGGFPGINAQLDLYPDSGWSVAVLANTEGGLASQLAVRVGELLSRLRR